MLFLSVDDIGLGCLELRLCEPGILFQKQRLTTHLSLDERSRIPINTLLNIVLRILRRDEAVMWAKVELALN